MKLKTINDTIYAFSEMVKPLEEKINKENFDMPGFGATFGDCNNIGYRVTVIENDIYELLKPIYKATLRLQNMISQSNIEVINRLQFLYGHK